VERTALVVNARDGINGNYRIRFVKHRANRNGGATTELQIGEKSSKGKSGQSGKKSGKGKGGSSGSDEISEVD